MTKDQGTFRWGHEALHSRSPSMTVDRLVGAWGIGYLSARRRRGTDAKATLHLPHPLPTAPSAVLIRIAPTAPGAP